MGRSLAKSLRWGMWLSRCFGDADSSHRNRMGFIGFLGGAVLVASALSIGGIGPAALALVLWILFGFFLGLPPLVGLLSTWELWKPSEAFTGLIVQTLLFVGALWAFEAAGLGELSILFAVFCGINGFLMAPAIIRGKQDEVKKLKSDGKD